MTIDVPVPAARQLASELAAEAASTRRLLERVPDDRLSWRPHTKSMSLGQLVHHIATMPGALAEMASHSSWESREIPRPEARSRSEVLEALENSVAMLAGKLKEWGDEGLRVEWELVRGDRALLVLPRGAVVRSVILNHWYHHRGQLTVYLRLLDVPLPPVYGDTADERPLG